MENPTYTVEMGCDAAWQNIISYTDSYGNQVPYTAFIVGDNLSAELWAGESTANLVVPTVSWATTPNTGVYNLSMSAAQTQSLTPGRYRLRVLVTATDNTIRPVLDEVLKVLASPGSTTTIKPYCSYQDLLKLSPWLDTLENVDTDLSGYLNQRLMGRDWIDSIIISRSPSTIGLPGYPFAGFWQMTGNGINNYYITQVLAENLLMLKPRLVQIVAHKSIAYIAAGLISDKNSDYGSKVTYHEQMATNLLGGYIAEIDLNGDGIADIPIPCNYFNSRVSTPSFGGWVGR